MNSFIVKVQESRFPRGTVLVYNEDRSVVHEAEPEREVVDHLGDRGKAFFYATLREDGQLELGEEAPWQDW